MSALDQCPSSKKQGKPVLKPRSTPHTLVGTSGQAYWRGLDDMADTPEFREHLEREFPSGASELLEGSRRTFLKLMGAGIALAGVATIPGCRRPDHKILTYSKNVPEDIIPGKPLFYATSMPLPGGGAEGLLIETHEGRPTKVEGNPLHPMNRGKSSVWSQSSVLDMYDPDRLKEPQLFRAVTDTKKKARTTDWNDGFVAATWDDFGAWSAAHFANLGDGAGLAFVVDRKTSPTLDAQRVAVATRWPKATWISYYALASTAQAEATKAAFGVPMREVPAYDKANVIVSLDRDFLQFEGSSLKASREFAAKRRPMTTKDAMNRLYCLETQFSSTGALADHRFRLTPQQITAAFVAIAKAVVAKAPNKSTGFAPIAGALDTVAVPAGSGLDEKTITAIANDLIDAANLGKSLIVVGNSQPVWVHALALSLNSLLGNIGATLAYLPMSVDESSDGHGALVALATRMSDGSIDTLVTLGANPVYNAPADADFAKAFANVPNRITLAVDANETAYSSNWRLNGAHYLEAWGDTQAADGTVAAIQPMIAPLYGGKSDIETLAIVLGQPKVDGYEIVRAQWRSVIGEADFERQWRRALHDGVLASIKPAPASPNIDMAKAGSAIESGKAWKFEAPTTTALHAAFACTNMGDGRHNNNAWLNELPEAASKIVWDNAAYLSPKTAEALGLMQTAETEKKPSGCVAELVVNGKSMRIVCWAVPGVADNAVVLPLGYGRDIVGLVGQGTGFNTFAVRTSAGAWAAEKVTLKPVTDGDLRYHLATTQAHSSMEGRAIVRDADVQAWAEFGDKTKRDKDSYGRDQELKFAERLEGGEFNQMPAAISVMQNPYDNVHGQNSKRSDRPIDEYPASFPKVAPFKAHPQWGMSIDLSACTGCNVCTIACQAENNIPVVGKIETNKGREMHWIRIDRYFKGSDTNDPAGMVFQPVACVHCENAPCESVCPVNATVHGSEGHNYMVYNRCIGTRYCANNCPYKVRRFNFFDYGVTKFNGNYLGQETLESVLPGFLAASEKTPHRINPNLIPPRVRDKLDEISKLQKNPNVTIRSRGVMEKCTYCIQRTNEAKIELKIKGIRNNDQALPDGFVQTACQQACPTGAIVFGDISDTKTVYKQADGSSRTGSLVHQMREHNRTYLLLGFLATKPRTTYMARINNPNPALRAANMLPFGEHGHGVHGGDGHGTPSPQGTEGPRGAGGNHSDAINFLNPSKVGRDGYVMSLSVLGARA